MAALLALTAAAAYGVGDFLGGMAARREPSTAVVLWSHVVGLVMLLLAAPALGGEATPRALAVGAVAGIGIALVAVTMVSREQPEKHGQRALRLQPLLLAIGAGVAFGLFFVAIDRAGSDAGIWPLVGARVASVSLFAALGAARLTAAAPPRAALGAALGCGLLDAAANVLYVLALSHGLLSVVSVLAALYPAGTVLLARYVLGERLTGVQRTGLAVAGLAAVLIAA